MKFQPKPISEEAVHAALDKADRYRLIRDPFAAESICRDVLRVEPGHQRAWVLLLLAITDQFASGYGVDEARAVLAHVKGEYEQLYYSGILWERHAQARMRYGVPVSEVERETGLRKAMEYYEQAEVIRPVGNDDALMRWNCCARLLNKYAFADPS